jgi:hypothetical protein
MANTILTIVFDTLEPKLDPVIAAAINELNKAGHTVKEIRLANDTGEVKIAPNMVEGVTPPPEEEAAPTFPS